MRPNVSRRGLPLIHYPYRGSYEERDPFGRLRAQWETFPKDLACNKCGKASGHHTLEEWVLHDNTSVAEGK